MTLRSMKHSLLMIVVLALAAASAFAKDQHTIALAYAVSVHGTTVAPGRYNVTCSAESGDPTVNFIRDQKVVASASAKWVERQTQYPSNEVVFETPTDGARKIIEIRFAGKSQALVFED